MATTIVTSDDGTASVLVTQPAGDPGDLGSWRATCQVPGCDWRAGQRQRLDGQVVMAKAVLHVDRDHGGNPDTTYW